MSNDLDDDPCVTLHRKRIERGNPNNPHEVTMEQINLFLGQILTPEQQAMSYIFANLALQIPKDSKKRNKNRSKRTKKNQKKNDH